MFENLSEKLDAALKTLTGVKKLSEENVTDALREVRRALLDADVNFQTVKSFVEDVRQKALGQEVVGDITPGQLMVKIIHDELVELMGGEHKGIKMNPAGPTIIMMVGLQGSGKTTHSAKLANHFKSKGERPMLVAADVYRPAAVDQLSTLGENLGVPVFTLPGENPVVIAEKALFEAKRTGRNVVIIDTAGRLTIDEEMMAEVANIKKAVRPNEILFVVDSMIGQDAVTTAKAFHDQLNFDGVILTKLDGDTRGGAALSIRAVVETPIKFIGTGEKMEALEPFYPERMASRILGMGDVVSLVEKAQEQFTEEQAAKLEEKLRKNQFTLEDFYQQIQTIKKMGSVRDLLGMIPGMGKQLKGVDIDDNAFKQVEAIILSMTKDERDRPDIINGSRRKRIANGSGTKVQDVNRLLRQFDQMRRTMKKLTKGNVQGAMKGMGLPAVPGGGLLGKKR
ncbi:MAG: signal recognition particle protein [Ignavibacteriae bacterium]|nr:signal recognition particle protein [Ignavibacteriota bacterium]MCB9214996.1 signal recognition particle protein [Ignavibacteria bacterium]